ncbi:MAG: protein kinase [Planctomycetia bacterium]|nr:protein kinase [Planctomycetia bacterium]
MIQERHEGTWPAGTRLMGGIYEVVPLREGTLYAEGGVGVVQRVHHREWAIDLAVKSPKPGTIRTELGKKNFERECQTWIELSLHPNIVNCYLVRRIDDIPRLFAELVPDGSLRDWIIDGRLYQGGKEKALARILDIGIQFAWGLDHAHEQNLLHLDVKPGNVMMAGDVAKVTDFGLARVIGMDNRMEGDTELCEGMTPSFCSPEQYDSFAQYQKHLVNGTLSAQNKKQESSASTSSSSSGVSANPDSAGKSDSSPDFAADPDGEGSSDIVELVPNPVDGTLTPITRKSDIWSWAISFLAMFNGGSPCKKGGQTADRVFEAFLKKESSEQYPDFPLVLVDIIRQCFRRDPNERPETMSEVAEHLIRAYESCTGNAYFRRQPKITVRTPEYLSNRAASMLDLDNPEGALKYFDEALKMNSWHPQILFNRVLTLWRMGKISDVDGLLQLEDLLRTKPDDINSYYALALFQRERGQIKAAHKLFSQAFDRDPKRDDIANALRLSVRELKQTVHSVAQFHIANEDPDEKCDSIFIDDRNEYILFPEEKDRMELVELASGEHRIKFRKGDPNPNFPGAQAYYDVEYRWELIWNENDEIIATNRQLKDAYSRSQHFKKIAWGRGRNACDEAMSIRAFARKQYIDLFDLKKGVALRSLIGHELKVDALSFSPNGKWLVSAAQDGSLRLWEAASCRCLRTLRDTRSGASSHTRAVQGVWIDKKSRYVFFLESGGNLSYWNVDLICNHADRIHAPLLMCNIISSEQMEIRQTEMKALFDNAVQEWKAGNFTASLDSYQKAKQFSEWTAFRTTESAQKWTAHLLRNAARSDLQEALSQGTYHCHSKMITSLVMTLNEKYTITAGEDRVIRVWDFLKISNEGTSAGESSVSNTGPRGQHQKFLSRELIGHTDWIRSVDLTVDGRFAVSGSWDQSVRIWDVQKGVELKRFPEKIRNITKVCFAPDGRTVAIGSSSGEIFLKDAGENVSLAQWKAHDSDVLALHCSRDGRYLISSGADKAIRIWKMSSKKLIRELNANSAIMDAVFSNDLHYVYAGSKDGELLTYDLLLDRKTPVRIQQGHISSITSLGLFTDGDRLVSGSKDNSVLVWNLRDNRQDHRFEGNYGAISAVSLNYNATRLLATTEDGFIRQWGLFWNFEYPGFQRSEEELDRMLRIVIGYYLFIRRIPMDYTPFRYYGDRAVDELPGMDGKPLNLDPKTIQRIQIEMEYRGFGNLNHKMINEKIIEYCNAWPGFIMIDEGK